MDFESAVFKPGRSDKDVEGPRALTLQRLSRPNPGSVPMKAGTFIQSPKDNTLKPEATVLQLSLRTKVFSGTRTVLLTRVESVHDQDWLWAGKVNRQREAWSGCEALNDECFEHLSQIPPTGWKEASMPLPSRFHLVM